MLKSGITKGFDWITIGIYLSLLLIGWLMLYAVVYDVNTDNNIFDFNSIIGKQTLWIVISLFVFVISLFINWKAWNSYSPIVYAIGVFLLLGVLLFGTNIKGATSWYTFGGVSFQPSEFAKLGTALLLARYTSYHQFSIKEPKYMWLSMAVFFGPIILILLQPDAGSAIVFLSFFLLLYRNGMNPMIFIISFSFIGIFIGSLVFNLNIVLFAILSIAMIFFMIDFKKKRYWTIALILWITVGLYFLNDTYSNWVLISNGIGILIMSLYHLTKGDKRKPILIIPILSIAILFGVLSTFVFDNVLKPHQQDRINVWLQPQKCDPRGSLYNLLQSKMAISSGGVKGKGYLKGTMTQMDFVPEQSTDFIFSTVGEEQGFLGSVALISLFAFLLIRIVFIGERAKNAFIQNYAYAILGIFFIHFFINIAMTVGLMPIVGIPLPFISKGGSSLVTFSLMIGILVRMDMDRQSRKNKYFDVQ